MKAEALFVALINTVQEQQTEKLIESLVKVIREALVDALFGKIAAEKKETQSRHWPM